MCVALCDFFLAWKNSFIEEMQSLSFSYNLKKKVRIKEKGHLRDLAVKSIGGAVDERQSPCFAHRRSQIQRLAFLIKKRTQVTG